MSLTNLDDLVSAGLPMVPYMVEREARVMTSPDGASPITKRLASVSGAVDMDVLAVALTQVIKTPLLLVLNMAHNDSHNLAYRVAELLEGNRLQIECQCGVRILG